MPAARTRSGKPVMNMIPTGAIASIRRGGLQPVVAVAQIDIDDRQRGRCFSIWTTAASALAAVAQTP
ncbi:MAG: hypothetical protein WDO24_14250 [Pseudomonadota bacterium]